ncbi:ISL3 family transposase, partial [Salmonella enterica subsp. enterica serovar Typhimurium]|nr:ISL3 family transposase [Salmonella enterica subsp. enterica serovar Typhimurium]
MSHNNSIKKLLNIKEDILKIINVEDENIDGITNKVIYATATKDHSNCPCCSNKLVKNGSKIVNIKILKSCQYNSILRVKKQRYFCKNCNKSFSQELNFVDKNCSISNDVKLAIKLELREAKTLKSIAKVFNVSQSTVARVIDSFDNYKVNYNYLPEKLCFDEFKSTKDTTAAMSFVYCNAENSEIIDVVEDRKLSSLIEYFSRFTKEARNNVKHIVIDMYKPYITLIKEMFPNAKISIDRFHLVQLINRAFNKLRIIVMNKQDERMYNKLKKYWKLLLKNSCELSSKKEKRGKMFEYRHLSEEDIVKILTSCDKELEETYELYQSFLIAI